jgi:hypothetical protein
LGILFRDEKTNGLFQIDYTYDEHELLEIRELNDKKKRGIPLTDKEMLTHIER